VSGGDQKHSGVRLLLALYCCFALGAQAGTFSAKVIVVMDGDTVMALRDGHKIKIRLANIDAPEKDQDFGKQSRDSLQEMVGRKVVRIDSHAVDQYGRIVGLISVDGRNINQEQVKRGMAWVSAGWRKRRQPTSEPSEGHIPADDFYINLQNEARQAHRGLWEQPNPQIPWRWRKLHPSLKPSPQANSRDASVHVDEPLLPDMKCGEKHRCSQMDSCDEARFYFTHCGLKTLDGNHDGSPCERLCSGK
jgi:micrococcal nuclease